MDNTENQPKYSKELRSENPTRHEPPSSPQSSSSEESENFSSIDSNSVNLDTSQVSIDEDGFTNKHTYKEKFLKFPEKPPHMDKLYEIYLTNVNRKKELKIIIEKLIEKQLQSLRANYDKEKSESFMVCEDEEDEDFENISQAQEEQREKLEEQLQSEDYKISKKNYDARLEELKKLDEEYREKKLVQFEMMVLLNDKQFVEALEKYAEACHETIGYSFENNFIYILSRETNHSKFKTPNEDFSNVHYFIRSFEVQAPPPNPELSTLPKLIPNRQTIKLPCHPNNKYSGFTYIPLMKTIFVYEGGELDVVKEIDGEYVLLESIRVDGIISSVWGESIENETGKVMIASDDGIVRLYDVGEIKKEERKRIREKLLAKISKTIKSKNKKEVAEMLTESTTTTTILNLNSIVLLNDNLEGKYSHFMHGNENSQILYVKNESNLCLFNLENYTSTLLHEFEETIVQIDENFIITKDKVYENTYSNKTVDKNTKKTNKNSDKDKKTETPFILNEKLSTLTKQDKKILKFHRSDYQYVIFEEKCGFYCIENIDKPKEQEKE